MSKDDSSSGRLSPKEYARQKRQEAYRRAKEQRAKDPRYLAMKEALRQSRRDAYQRIKEQRKAALAEQKVKRKVEATEKRSVERSAGDAELMKMLQQWRAKGPSVEN